MEEGAIRDTYRVERPDQAACLLNPLRAEILAVLREPASPAQVARQLNESPQRMNYHIKELAKVGLVQRLGTRTVRNLVEVVFQSVARTFVIADTLGWAPDKVRQMKDQGSLGHLVTVADRLRRDALVLMERSDAGAEVPSASLAGEVRLRSGADRQAFVKEYVTLVRQLIDKYGGGADPSDAYAVLLAVYPQVAEEEKQ